MLGSMYEGYHRRLLYKIHYAEMFRDSPEEHFPVPYWQAVRRGKHSLMAICQN
jgi:hypothetical protein